MTTELATTNFSSNALMGILPDNPNDAWQLAQIVADSGLAPPVYKNNPAAVFTCFQFGKELGLTPGRALNGIMVLNGIASLHGQVMVGLIQAHPEYEGMEEKITYDDNKKPIITITLKRKNRGSATGSFGWADAERAGLSGKSIWKQYPKDLCFYKAFRRVATRLFADALCGMSMVEDIRESVIAEERPVYDATPAENGHRGQADRLTEALKAKQASPAPAPDDELLQEIGEEDQLNSEWTENQLNEFKDQVIGNDIVDVSHMVETTPPAHAVDPWHKKPPAKDIVNGIPREPGYQSATLEEALTNAHENRQAKEMMSASYNEKGRDVTGDLIEEQQSDESLLAALVKAQETHQKWAKKTKATEKGG